MFKVLCHCDRRELGLDCSFFGNVKTGNNKLLAQIMDGRIEDALEPGQISFNQDVETGNLLAGTVEQKNARLTDLHADQIKAS